MSDNLKKLRHWSYQRQNLGKTGSSVIQVLRNVIGVYSSHPSTSLSLFARLNQFSKHDFYQLDENKLA